MPLPGLIWRYVTLSTHSTWLPGDPRGWRSRNHRKHSSGDYKQRPPPTEHAGLHRHTQSISSPKVVLPPPLRSTIGEALLRKIQKLRAPGPGQWRCLCIAVAPTHAHLLIELPIDPAEAKAIVGQLKQYASHQVRRNLPRQIWAEGGDLKPIETPQHWRAAYVYILTKQGPVVWTSSFKQGVTNIPH